MSSKPRTDVVVDSVILHYFLLAEQQRLPFQMLGEPLRVPRVVYDPDEAPNTPPPAMSEMTRAIDYHRRLTNDPTRPPDARRQAAVNAQRLGAIADLATSRAVDITEMTRVELELFGGLTNPQRVAEFGLHFPLGNGEAACVAIAVKRGWTIATDDNDALAVLQRLGSQHPYERIRKLLIRAANQALITPDEANAIHDTMTRLGFWDRHKPFPRRRA